MILGKFIKTFGALNPAAMILALSESKHVGTYRGSTSSKDSAARMNVLMNPNALTAQRRNHQLGRASLETQVRNFGREIARSIRQIRSGSPRGFVVKELKAEFRTLYKNAYDIGMSSSSTGLVPQNASVSAEDQRWVESAFKHEMRFFNRFLSQALDANMSPAQIDHRISMYMNAVRGVYEAGRVIGSHPDSLIYWVYNPEAHHCTSCVYLRDHSPYTKRSIPTTPRAGGTECLTHCKCHLRIVISDPEAVKQVDSRSTSRSSHLSFLSQIKNRRSRLWPNSPDRAEQS